MSEPGLKCENYAIFRQNYTLELFVAFKMAYSCCFDWRGNLDFPDFLQKKFYNIDYWTSFSWGCPSLHEWSSTKHDRLYPKLYLDHDCFSFSFELTQILAKCVSCFLGHQFFSIVVVWTYGSLDEKCLWPLGYLSVCGLDKSSDWVLYTKTFFWLLSKLSKKCLSWILSVYLIAIFWAVVVWW